MEEKSKVIVISDDDEEEICYLPMECDLLNTKALKV
jgi:hypothetical protein